MRSHGDTQNLNPREQMIADRAADGLCICGYDDSRSEPDRIAIAPDCDEHGYLLAVEPVSA